MTAQDASGDPDADDTRSTARSTAWAAGTVPTADGTLSYQCTGSGPVLLALHGIQGTSSAWTNVAGILASEYTVIAPDLRGREPSMIPSGRDAYALDRFASDLDAVVAAVGRPEVLVGWSMGVFVALEHLRRGGPRPRSLVLAGGSAHLGDDARWFTGSSSTRVEAEAAARAERLGLGRTATPHAVAQSWWHASRADYRDFLAQVPVPALVIHGTEDDQCPPSHARALVEGLPEGRLDLWDGCGHNPMSHDHERFADRVRAFSRRPDAARASEP